MADFKPGDQVVLISGSMRMAVESVDKDQVSCVWANEGTIGRDSFASILLRKWEVREDEKPRQSFGKPYKGDRDRDGGGHRGRDDRPKGKPGWDGKPREKKYFRKD